MSFKLKHLRLLQLLLPSGGLNLLQLIFLADNRDQNQTTDWL